MFRYSEVFKQGKKDGYLILQVFAQLLPGQVVVGIQVNLLEDVDRGGSIFDSDQFDVKNQSSTAWNDLSSTLQRKGSSYTQIIHLRGEWFKLPVLHNQAQEER